MRFFLDDISSDQYIGMMFGLTIADGLLPEEDRATIRALIVEIFEFLEKNDWKIRNSDGSARQGGVLHPYNIFGMGSAEHLLVFARAYALTRLRAAIGARSMPNFTKNTAN
ncbi:MAG: hypothetical protein HZA25_01695 [Candidatus Niyogibacteria bacterium]|nr:hypothetical protein [Candidatus Niyogibacteria bacterium]